MKLFIDDAATVEFGQNFIHIISLAMPLAAATMTMMMFFQASAKKAQATALSMMRKGILDIPLMFLFNSVWPVYGVATRDAGGGNHRMRGGACSGVAVYEDAEGSRGGATHTSHL